MVGIPRLERVGRQSYVLFYRSATGMHSRFIHDIGRLTIPVKRARGLDSAVAMGWQFGWLEHGRVVLLNQRCHVGGAAVPDLNVCS